jgi:sigma-B regulation protein RsbQ
VAIATNTYSWVTGFAPAAMGNTDRPHLADEFARTLKELRPDVALAVVRAIFESDHRADLDGFNKESLILQSESDIAVPLSVGQYLNRAIPNSKLEIINATGHFPHISAPKEVTEALNAFL